MKKSLSVILTLVLTLCLAASCFCAFAADDHVCKDEERNVTFTVPADWEDGSEPGDTVLFSLDRQTENTYENFNYYSMDIYGQALLENSDQLGKVKREDYDNDILTVEEFEDTIKDAYSSYNVLSCEAEKAKIGSNYYFRANAKIDFGSGKASDIVQFCHIYDGYAYYFTFGSSDELAEADIQTIMLSVAFNDETGSNRVKTDGEKIGENIAKGAGKGILRYVIIAAAVFVIGIIAGAIKSKKNKNAQPPVTPAAQPPVTPPYNPENTAPAFDEAPAEEPEAPAEEPAPADEAPADETVE